MVRVSSVHRRRSSTSSSHSTSRRPEKTYEVGDSSDDESSDGNVDRDYDALMYAQKLNNNAAMCIEIGYYERATKSLQKALEVSQKIGDRTLTQVCRCDGCAIDGNIDFSADFAPSTGIHNTRGIEATGKRYDGGDDETSDDSSCYAPPKRVSSSKLALLTKSISQPKLQKVSPHERNTSANGSFNSSWSLKDEYCEQELDEEDRDDEIYKRPIRVVRESHTMGSSLFLIITFNLALTHHLEVAASKNHKSHNSKSAKKTLLFYELSSTYETRLTKGSSNYWDSLSSIRFNTILNNNLNHLLKILPDKYLSAAHRLLSNVSIAFDDESERFSGTSIRKKRTSDRKTRSKNRGDRQESSNNLSSHSRSSLSSHSRKKSRDRLHDSGNSLASRSRKNYESFGSPSSQSSSRKSLGGYRSNTPSPRTNRKQLELALGDMVPKRKKQQKSRR